MAFAMPVPAPIILATAEPANEPNNWGAGFGKPNLVKIYDHRDGSIKSLEMPQPDGESAELHQLHRTHNGILFFQRTTSSSDREIRYLKILTAEPPPAPTIVDDLPAVLNMDEGDITEISWHAEGLIPDEGINVVVERISGDGDVRVVAGGTGNVRYHYESRTVRIAARWTQMI